MCWSHRTSYLPRLPPDLNVYPFIFLLTGASSFKCGLKCSTSGSIGNSLETWWPGPHSDLRNPYLYVNKVSEWLNAYSQQGSIKLAKWSGKAQPGIVGKWPVVALICDHSSVDSHSDPSQWDHLYRAHTSEQWPLKPWLLAAHFPGKAFCSSFMQ